jgi:CDP-glycerol glycerophosphotransferase (TagB/SpsB family)
MIHTWHLPPFFAAFGVYSKQGQFPAKKFVKDDVYYTPLQVTKASEKRKISMMSILDE